MAGGERPKGIDTQRTRDEIAALMRWSKQTIEDAQKIEQELERLRAELDAAIARNTPIPPE